MNSHAPQPSDQVVTELLDIAHATLEFEPGTGSGRPANLESMADRVEHTLLGSACTDNDLQVLCAEAARHKFRAVCCLPRDVSASSRILAGSNVLVVTVIDFPLAGGTEGDRVNQTKRVIDLGADEVDMVVNVRALKAGQLQVVRDGVQAVCEAAAGKPVKVILETGLLSPVQIVRGSASAEAGGAAFVKTSTGFGPRGASVEDVKLMRAAVGARLGIKASGGIRDRETASAMIEAGADLLGTSNGPACVG